ncbi:MAG: energy transducer TonB [Labilithrix sp.]|nr:energy transducer TonB [Labilithrix sp.]MCW5816841.1 energy transducer TonB [Labilithrix sp.]
MTTVMRAVAPPGGAPRVPRIAVVAGGRVVEERLVTDKKSVTVGATEDATFNAPVPRFELLARRGQAYVLHLCAGATARVSVGGHVRDLAGPCALPLAEDARGKVVVGATTFLFQLVRPPPPPPRPQLPLAVKGGFANQIDWSLTILAALSFLLHFGIVGAMYSDWMDGVADDGHSVAGLVDMMKSIPPPPVVETPAEDAPTHVTTPTPTPTSTSTSTQKTATTSPGKTGGRASANANASDARAAALLAQAEQMEIGLLVAPGSKSAVESALRRSEIPPVDLSGAAASDKGVATTASDLRLPGGGPTVTGPRPGGLAVLGGDTHATMDGKSADARVVAIPKFDTQVGNLGGSAATVSGADRVIAGLRSRFRTCYQRGLASDPTMSGKVVITAKVAPNGEVATADVASSTGNLSGDVNTCILQAIKRAQFDAQPGGAPATLSIPVSLVHQ